VKRMIIAGAGGHARVVTDLISDLGGFDVVGYTESDAARVGTAVNGFSILGGDEALSSLRQQGVEYAANAVGSISTTSSRRLVFERLISSGFVCPLLIHPTAWLGPAVHAGRAVQIMPCAMIQGRAHIGDNVVVNTGALVEHDCWVEDHAYISPCVRLGGEVSIGEGAFIGIGSTIRQGIRIGARALVGAGSVVVSNVPAGVSVCGVPARPMPEREP
jgi:sugar O-acyltransferase (sialic acid O-acetyltransferase NeuD family)